MRRIIMAVCVLAVVVYGGCGSSYVVATGEGVGIYERQVRKVYDRPLFIAGTEERLMVIARGKRALEVQTTSGERGWVEKRLVKTVSSRGFVFEHADVLGYIDTPPTTFVLAGDGPGEEPIRLDRSFREALADNVDRETVSRQTK